MCETKERQPHNGVFPKFPRPIPVHGWPHKPGRAQLVVDVTRLERLALSSLQFVPGHRVDVLEDWPLAILLERLVDELQKSNLRPREHDRSWCRHATSSTAPERQRRSQAE